MRPHTLHYVITMEDAFVYGRHFLATSTIQDTTWGIVHCFIKGLTITNDMHNELGTMLRRMMAMWHIYYYDQVWRFSPPQDPHIPNLATVEGLMDCIAVGNVLELAQVLDRRAYLKAGIHWLEQQEMAMARWRYRLIQKIFAKSFVTVVGGQHIHPMSIFRRSLLEFAVALFQYKEDTAPTAPKLPGCTPATMEAKLSAYFQSNYPELVPAFRKLLEKGVASFRWSGPLVVITRRKKVDETAGAQDPPSFNFTDLVLYEPGDLTNNVPAQVPDTEEEVVIVEMNEAATQVTQQREPPPAAVVLEENLEVTETNAAPVVPVIGLEGEVDIQDIDMAASQVVQPPASPTTILSEPDVEMTAFVTQSSLAPPLFWDDAQMSSPVEHSAEAVLLDAHNADITTIEQQSAATNVDIGITASSDSLAEPGVHDGSNAVNDDGMKDATPQYDAQWDNGPLSGRSTIFAGASVMMTCVM
jgi:hypothetical protein